MTYPMQEKIQKVLDQLSDNLNPTEEEREVCERVLIDLIKTHGFEASQAYKIVRTIYWQGWNEGWGRGYRETPPDHGSTLL